jgi:hypothetical protein
MPAPPYRAIAERKITDRLLQANAVWPGSGQPLEHLHGAQTRALARLVAEGVIREEGAGHYYVYAPAYAAHMGNRRRRVMIAMICVIIAMAGGMIGVFTNVAR